MHSEILKQLTNLAYEKTIPFCYGCYSEAPAGCCTSCGSDDLMRLLPGSGCEYGTEWVVREILREKLEPVDLEKAFEESIRDCYPETTKVGWMDLDTIDTMKNSDPIWWRCAITEWESNEEAEGNIISFDGGAAYYWIFDVQNLVHAV